VCANADRREGALAVTRLACGTGGTEPISQAAATSQYVFDDPDTAVIDSYLADWAVIARDDDFADALAGSSLSFGQGPLLFTYSPRSAQTLGRDPGLLADITRAELLRTLPRGRTVYLLGGTAALSDGLDAQLRDLGYEVVRFAGSGREETAALVSREVTRLVDDFSTRTGFPDLNTVLITTGSNWPDAVVAGSVGSFWGMPILLTNADFVHPATLAALDELRPDYIHAIGGTAVISSETGGVIANHARNNGYGVGRQGEDLTAGPWKGFVANCFICRWPGGNRIETAAAVTQLNRDLVGRFAELNPAIPANPQQYAVAVSLGVRCTEAPQPDGSCRPEAQDAAFPYTLAAATVSGRFGGAVFIPTDNDTLNATTRDQLCLTPGAEGFIERVEELVVVGDTDLLSESFIGQIQGLAQEGCP
jgi:putative cell wall-binding protein